MATTKKTSSSAEKAATSGGAAKRVKAETTARFPYTTKPGSLRRILKEIPKKPKPPKFDSTLLKAWGFKDTNDTTAIRVLKAVNLLNANGEPTEKYAGFMNLERGAKILGPEIRRVYELLFDASHAPYSEGNEKLQNLFNIHSGGSRQTLDLQIQTFKALCENADFVAVATTDGAGSAAGTAGSGSAAGGAGDGNSGRDSGSTIVHINLHIHLPENKSRRDYEDIIEDIGKYIFGRKSGDRDG